MQTREDVLTLFSFPAFLAFAVFPAGRVTVKTHYVAPEGFGGSDDGSAPGCERTSVNVD